MTSNTELVIGDAAELIRGTYGSAAAQFIVNNCSIDFSESHIQPEDVFLGYLVAKFANKRPQHALLVHRGRVKPDPGLRATVEQVHGSPFPSHNPGQAGNFWDVHGRGHPSAALANTAGGVVDHQHTLHANVRVTDDHDFFGAPFVQKVEIIAHKILRC